MCIRDRVKTMNESIYYNVDEIHRAISEERQISFLYSEYKLDKKLHPRRNGERYTVSPYLLLWNDGYYYLVAYYERYGGLSHFRVDKDVYKRQSKRCVKSTAWSRLFVGSQKI